MKLRQYFQILSHSYGKILVVLCGLFVVAHMSNVFNFAAWNNSHRSVISASDDDAAWGIYKATITRWYKDNGWAHYGPLYFRAAHTLNWFFPNSVELDGETPKEQFEKSAHMQIMLISLLSLFLMSGFFISLFTKSWPVRLIGSSVVTAAFLHNPEWSRFYLRAHPDILFSLLVAIAGWLTFLMLKFPKNRFYFISSAFMWGFVTCTKLSVALFVPGFIILFIPPFQRERLIEGLKYVGYMFLSYFAIGFPQNIVLDRPVKFMLKQNKYSSMADPEAIQRWIELFRGQIALPLAMIFMFYILFADKDREEPKLPRKLWMRYFAFILIPTIMLMGRKITSPHEHYTFPFVAIWILLVVLILKHDIPNKLKIPVPKWVLLVAMIFLTRMSYGFLPQTLNNELQQLWICRAEAVSIHKKVTEFAVAGKQVLVDPYVPYPSEFSGENVHLVWGTTLDHLKQQDYRLLAFRKKYYERYLADPEPSSYVQTDVPHWPKVRTFYKVFAGQSEAITHDTMNWKKTYSDNCGWEMWERVKN